MLPPEATHSPSRYADSVLGAFFETGPLPHLAERLSPSLAIGHYTLLWVQGGCGQVRVDQVLHTLQPHTLLCITPLQYVQIEPCLQGVYYTFNREFYCIQENEKEVSCIGFLFYGSSFVPIIQLDAAHQRKLRLLHGVFEDELLNQDHIQGEMLRMLLKRLIIIATRLARQQYVDPSLGDDKLDLVRQYQVLVEMHFRKHHDVASYADMLNKAPKTLANVFHLFSASSPLQIIHERLLLEARRMLAHTDVGLKEIAYHLGFEDQAAFNKFFKKKDGNSPGAYREAARARAGRIA